MQTDSHGYKSGCKDPHFSPDTNPVQTLFFSILVKSLHSSLSGTDGFILLCVQEHEAATSDYLIGRNIYTQTFFSGWCQLLLYPEMFIRLLRVKKTG